MDENAELVNDIVFGKRIEHFLSGDIGQYILVRIENETKEVTDKLIVADPTDSKLITALQNRILVVQSIKEWLEDALMQALESETRLNEIENQENPLN